MAISECPNFERCGSCSWSHIPYPNQLEQKLADINGALRSAKAPFSCEIILPSPVTAHYRNRMDFAIDFEGRFGLREKGKWWKVIDGHHCFIADYKIESAFAQIKPWLRSSELSFYDRKANKGLLRYAVLRTNTKNELLVNIVTSAPTEADKTQQVLTELASELSPYTFYWAINQTNNDVSQGDTLHLLHGHEQLEESVLGVRYLIRPQAFFQTNPHALPSLVQTVLEFSGNTKSKNILDLYCGSGFFALALAKNGGAVTGIEIVPSMIEDAKANAALNGLEANFVASEVEKTDFADTNYDLVIVDPPRSGLHPKALDKLLALAPKNIVYVSCNYRSFAQEFVRFQEHYTVTAIKAIDMFPHTPHVELVTRLERTG